ncbi:unnamed protein product [Strongylus vulgaris]|uniref:Uncharacterized protein n=1 Tax=Strongylus vulgaris TaxID=40348 RepID=A0A3P7M1R2_STRVU|nr:unnamed protein product [Strongylus vulgaris]
MRSFYNAELSVVGTPADAPYKTVAEGWLAALQLNPARLVPDRLRPTYFARFFRFMHESSIPFLSLPRVICA